MLSRSMDKSNCNFISWNVRGLNLKTKRNVVRETISSSLAAVECIQETKLVVIDSRLSMEILGPSFDGFFYLPTYHTRGSLLLGWNSLLANYSSPSVRSYSITAEIEFPCGLSSWLTTVYDPSEDSLKVEFIQELRDIHSAFSRPWMIMGDFNLLLQAADKNMLV